MILILIFLTCYVITIIAMPEDANIRANVNQVWKEIGMLVAGVSSGVTILSIYYYGSSRIVKTGTNKGLKAQCAIKPLKESEPLLREAEIRQFKGAKIVGFTASGNDTFLNCEKDSDRFVLQTKMGTGGIWGLVPNEIFPYISNNTPYFDQLVIRIKISEIYSLCLIECKSSKSQIVLYPRHGDLSESVKQILVQTYPSSQIPHLYFNFEEYEWYFETQFMPYAKKITTNLTPTVVELVLWRDLFGPLFGSFCTSELVYLLSKEDEKYQPWSRINIQDEIEMWKFILKVKIIYHYFSLTGINRKKLKEMRTRLKIYRHLDSIGREIPKRSCKIATVWTAGSVAVYFEKHHEQHLPKEWKEVKANDLSQGFLDPDNKLGVDVLAWFFGNGFGFLEELRRHLPHLPANGWSKSLESHLKYLDSNFDETIFDGNCTLKEIEKRIDKLEIENYDFRDDPKLQPKDIPKEHKFELSYQTPLPTPRNFQLDNSKIIVAALQILMNKTDPIVSISETISNLSDKTKFTNMMKHIFVDFTDSSLDNIESLQIKSSQKSLKLIEGRMPALRQIVKDNWINLSLNNIDDIIGIVVNTINHKKDVSLNYFLSNLGIWIKNLNGTKRKQRTQTERKADRIESKRKDRLKRLKLEEI
eukprot:TRINITY_DN8476_c0_g1_i2.p1 TRINITY_DN8476_c0_g1~~TRINITY_DN8476_c0_g1_i2.p1  ORF type:complete len:644 (-),score=88.72 TRINITY_DN8476_c0_g1_i2:107-2038(-)